MTITFEKSAVLGTDKPVRFDGGEDFVQYFNLKEGWNWVSFNVNSYQLENVNTLLSRMSWSEGDILTDLSSDTTLVYKGGKWLASGNTSEMAISPKKAYAIKVQEDCSFPIGGRIIKEKDARTIVLEPGWNGIGYTPMANLSVETALSDYYDEAEPGDVIKSHTEFAYFTKTGSTGRWRGSLQYMKPGEGYMMLRKGTTGASFTYPFFEMNSYFGTDGQNNASRRALPMRSTMSVSAAVAGIELEEGDRLLAYADGEVVGEASVPSAYAAKTRGIAADTAEPIYLNIAGNGSKAIWFAIERGGEVVASSGEVMTFRANAVVGSPDEPIAILFADSACENAKWYTLSGLQLQRKPTEKGVYIYSGKKVIIK